MDAPQSLAHKGGKIQHVHTQMGLLPSATCECGTEEQTPDHILCTCPMYRPPHGLCGLVELDESTKKWLLEAARTSSLKILHTKEEVKYGCACPQC